MSENILTELGNFRGYSGELKQIQGNKVILKDSNIFNVDLVDFKEHLRICR